MLVNERPRSTAVASPHHNRPATSCAAGHSPIRLDWSSGENDVSLTQSHSFARAEVHRPPDARFRYARKPGPESWKWHLPWAEHCPRVPRQSGAKRQGAKVRKGYPVPARRGLSQRWGTGQLASPIPRIGGDWGPVDEPDEIGSARTALAITSRRARAARSPRGGMQTSRDTEIGHNSPTTELPRSKNKKSKIRNETKWRG